MFLLTAADDDNISMSISNQEVDLINISGGGASVLLPHANLYDV